ncbi:hypothetical protein CSUI_003629 [Cystoisospora suis]|uniref:Uncharacterized protein n=1 Tax=Cystoisospora suis TaxID=483139 RepID=A0A2C6L457_9APIC|nr:hypothetical protein CSUI_003629 [Cystoisospora suis]
MRIRTNKHRRQTGLQITDMKGTKYVFFILFSTSVVLLVSQSAVSEAAAQVRTDSEGAGNEVSGVHTLPGSASEVLVAAETAPDPGDAPALADTAGESGSVYTRVDADDAAVPPGNPYATATPGDSFLHQSDREEQFTVQQQVESAEAAETGSEQRAKLPSSDALHTPEADSEAEKDDRGGLVLGENNASVSGTADETKEVHNFLGEGSEAPHAPMVGTRAEMEEALPPATFFPVDFSPSFYGTPEDTDVQPTVLLKNRTDIRSWPLLLRHFFRRPLPGTAFLRAGGIQEASEERQDLAPYRTPPALSLLVSGFEVYSVPVPRVPAAIYVGHPAGFIFPGPYSLPVTSVGRLEYVDSSEQDRTETGQTYSQSHGQADKEEAGPPPRLTHHKESELTVRLIQPAGVAEPATGGTFTVETLDRPNSNAVRYPAYPWQRRQQRGPPVYYRPPVYGPPVYYPVPVRPGPAPVPVPPYPYPLPPTHGPPPPYREPPLPPLPPVRHPHPPPEDGDWGFST